MLRRLLVGFCLLALGMGSTLRAQSIRTVAGGGTVDGQLASAIHTDGPRGITTDANGNVYVVVSLAGQVLRIDAVTRLVTTIAGNGSSGFGGDDGLATNATLRQPEGLAFDAAGNLYIADTENDRIRRVDAKSGIITTFAGGGNPPEGTIGDGGPARDAFVGNPWGLLIRGGALYFTEEAYNAHRVRKVDLATGVITTVAGKAESSRGGFGGDNGPAKDAIFGENGPLAIVADAAGNLFVADNGNNRVRRIGTDGIITTVAGGAAADHFGDGGPATAAFLDGVLSLVLDRAGNLLISTPPGLRRVDHVTNIITTVLDQAGFFYGMAVDSQDAIYVSDTTYGEVFRIPPGYSGTFDSNAFAFAGGGSFVGDGRLGPAAILHGPQGIALDSAGNLFIADTGGNLVRRVSAADGTISTVAGVVGRAYSETQEGIDATAATIGFPFDVTFDSSNNLYIADPLNLRVWRVDGAGKITSVAGGGSPADGVGDAGLATQALVRPIGISVDRNGNLYIADTDAGATVPRHRVRRVDAVTKIITTIAGGNVPGYAGDAGPARNALLSSPSHAVPDDAGNLYIADSGNGAIRKIDSSGTITTIAGHKSDGDPIGDDGPAIDARVTPYHLAFQSATGDLLVTDFSNNRVRRIDRNGKITTVAGSGVAYYDAGYSGDNGRATDARLNLDYTGSSGVAVSATGEVFFADSANNRIRAVAACVSVAAPALAGPADGAQTTTAPALSWKEVTGAFRYDVLLDTVNPPLKTLATDISETSVTPANLQPATKYFWRVVAKGDPFCPAVAKASSSVASFTTSGKCAAGAFDLIAPADGAALGPGNTISWQASAGAGSYDLYLGGTNPPRLVLTGTTSTTFQVVVSDARMYWFVVAHAACDPTQTATTPVRSFTAPFTRTCDPVPPTVSLVSPAAGSTGVDLSPELSWSLSNDTADSYDLYFGTNSSPPLLLTNLAASQTKLPPLSPATTYYWRVVANKSCFPSGQISSAVGAFTTRTVCVAPGPISILFAPAAVSAGSTYAIVWSSSAGLDADGGYLVERSTSAAFDGAVESQITSSTAASFVTTAATTWYHRVRALPSCDVSKSGPVSDVKSVLVKDAAPNIVFTVQPRSVVAALGERLEDTSSSFSVENLGTAPVQVIIGQQELGGSPPFFTVAEEAAFITLEPRKPRSFTIRFSGPRNDVPASYQAVLFVVSLGPGLNITPYAFVNLKVGGAPAAVPQFVVDGTPTDYVALSGYSGDDAGRPPRQITIHNTGSTPLELAAEIGPELWLSPEANWNATPLPGNASRSVNLFTRRTLAPNGSALPRYTYLTVRTKDGASARLLVQDNDQPPVGAGRATALPVGGRSFIIPEVVSRTSAGGKRLVTRMRLSNLGGDAAQAEILYTPSGSDGFDAVAVKRAVVLVPPNDVVTLTDPIVQLFGLPAPGAGAIEVRFARERLGLVNVRSSIAVLGGTGGFDTPVVTRGEGARLGSPHAVDLLPGSNNVTLVLAETSGVDGATVLLTRLDGDGNVLGSSTLTLARYGMLRLSGLVATRFTIAVQSGGGSVIGLATIASTSGEAGASALSRAVSEGISGAALIEARRLRPSDTVPISITTVVPVVATPASAGAAPSFRTALGLAAASLPATFTASFRSASGGSTATVRNVNVAAGGLKVYSDLMVDLFGLPASTQGSVFVQSPVGAKVYAVLQQAAGSSSTPVPSSYLPLPSSVSEAVTSAASTARRPLSFDGLEQSVDASRGTRWLLILNELGGATGVVNVRLYEAGNRSRAIADQDVVIGAYQQLKLDTIFGALGLDGADRRKDRTNVQVVVTAVAGSARIAAAAMSVDNQSGDTRVVPLLPAVGSGVPNISVVAPVTNQTPPATRRRAIGH